MPYQEDVVETETVVTVCSLAGLLCFVCLLFAGLFEPDEPSTEIASATPAATTVAAAEPSTDPKAPSDEVFRRRAPGSREHFTNPWAIRVPHASRLPASTRHPEKTS